MNRQSNAHWQQRGRLGGMRGHRGMNTERLYRHCQCGDLLQEARGSREEEVGQKDHREGTTSESKPKTLFKLCRRVQAEASSQRHLRGVTSHL